MAIATSLDRFTPWAFTEAQSPIIWNMLVTEEKKLFINLVLLRTESDGAIFKRSSDSIIFPRLSGFKALHMPAAFWHETAYL